MTQSGSPDARTLGVTTLPAALASVPAARRFAVGCLASEHASPDTCDAVALLTAEVVTNAVLHAVSPVTVTVAVSGDDEATEVARISVHDDDPRQPVVHDHGVDASTGRGMRLVEAISLAWGAEAEEIGKTVWFEVLVHATDADIAASFSVEWSDLDLDLS